MTRRTFMQWLGGAAAAMGFGVAVKKPAVTEARTSYIVPGTNTEIITLPPAAGGLIYYIRNTNDGPLIVQGASREIIAQPGEEVSLVATGKGWFRWKPGSVA